MFTALLINQFLKLLQVGIHIDKVKLYAHIEQYTIAM